MTEADELAERKADLLAALGKLLPGEPSPPADLPPLVRCEVCRGLVQAKLRRDVWALCGRPETRTTPGCPYSTRAGSWGS